MAKRRYWYWSLLLLSRMADRMQCRPQKCEEITMEMKKLRVWRGRCGCVSFIRFRCWFWVLPQSASTVSVPICAFLSAINFCVRLRWFFRFSPPVKSMALLCYCWSFKISCAVDHLPFNMIWEKDSVRKCRDLQESSRIFELFNGIIHQNGWRAWWMRQSLLWMGLVKDIEISLLQDEYEMEGRRGANESFGLTLQS